MYKIILDAMGGDNAPAEIISGAFAALSEVDDISITLVGRKREIDGFLSGMPQDRISILEAEDVIEMAESPVNAIKTKKDSSLVRGMSVLAEGGADAFVTAGNTGAVIAGAALIVRRASGVERPALAPLMPTINGSVLLVDCGANVDCKASQLLQFGVMGSIYMQTLMDIPNPRVGLISNGAEPEKGNAVTKQAHALLAESELNFVGNIEGRDVMLGVCDVLVSDGFVGNVLMKTVEGTASALMSMIKEGLYSSGRTRIGAMLAKPALHNIKRRMDYSEYGGALMLGVKAGVIKAHGSSDAKSIKNAIIQARNFAADGVVQKISEKLEAKK